MYKTLLKPKITTFVQQKLVGGQNNFQKIHKVFTLSYNTVGGHNQINPRTNEKNKLVSLPDQI